MKYLCDPHILPAIMPESVGEFAAYVEVCRRFSREVQLDVMDGVFAPNKKWPLTSDDVDGEVARLADALNGMSCEVHLMVQDPVRLGSLFARAGATRIVTHVEVFDDISLIPAVFAQWKAEGAQEAGLALKIETPLSIIENVLAQCDEVLLMSIAEIGFQGRPFDDRVLTRVEELHAMAPNLMVAVDGGVSEATVEDLVRAGANRLIVGGVLRESEDPEAVYMELMERAMRGCAPIPLGAQA